MGSADYILLNWLPISIAAIASFIFGAVWYILFKRTYAYATDTRQERRGLGIYLVVLILEWWMAAILIGALILAPVEAGKWTVGLGSAAIIWAGFMFPATIVNTLLRRAPFSLALIDGLHWLGVLLVQASVMILIGTTAPDALPALP